MNLPKIDLSSLPGLDLATGLFGSLVDDGPTVDDRIVVIMTYIYELAPGDSLF